MAAHVDTTLDVETRARFGTTARIVAIETIHPHLSKRATFATRFLDHVDCLAPRGASLARDVQMLERDPFVDDEIQRAIDVS